MPEGYNGGNFVSAFPAQCSLLSGSVLRITENVLPNKPANASRSEEDEEDEDQDMPETKAVEELATFDEVMVWGHESVAEAADDPYAKGIKEWVSFASAVCTFPVTSIIDIDMNT